MIKKPTVEDLYQLWLKGRGQPFGEFCYDAGIQHAREEMAQKRGPRPENPYDGSFRHEGTAWDIGFADAIAWADSGRPDPAPASEELVERIAQLLKELSYKQRPGDGTWSGDARAVLAEIAKSARAATEAGNVIGWIARAVDAEKTISTLEAQLKEAQTHEEDWQRRALDYESCWKKAIAQARAQIETLEARVKELEAERESDHKLHESQADIIAKVAAELATARERVKELEGELATVKWDRECLQKTRDRLEEEELATAREQHRAEVEELKADLRSANTVIDSTQSKLAETQRELASSRDRAESYRAQFAYEKDEHSATRAQLAARDEELRKMHERALIAEVCWANAIGNFEQHHRAREALDALRAKASPSEKKPEHVCGLRGFPESGDTCPACAKASPPPGERDDIGRQVLRDLGIADVDALNDGPPRVGDLLEITEVHPDSWATRRNPSLVGCIFKVEKVWSGHPFKDYDGFDTDSFAPEAQSIVCKWRLVRRAQPSPVATAYTEANEWSGDQPSPVASEPKNPHTGSALDAAHMAETGCVVAPGEVHDCPAVYPGEQADARALVEEFAAERKAAIAADLDRPPGGHGSHDGEIAELKRKVDEMYNWFVNRCESEKPVQELMGVLETVVRRRHSPGEDADGGGVTWRVYQDDLDRAAALIEAHRKASK